MTRAKKKRKTAPEETAQLITGRTTCVYLALVSAAAVVCFFPLLRYFFAQDDFVLMHAAWLDGWGAIGEFFTRTPGHFRPLTKAAYFGVMYRFFGLNPVPWHAVSLVVHIININLFYVLLRRVRVTAAAALITTTLFGLSVAFLHVIAWAACIQQLLGLCFMLAALVWGIEYIQDGDGGKCWLSLMSYVLALTSVEQTFGVPVVLMGCFYLLPGERGTGKSLPVLARKLWTHLSVMVGYLVFMAVWKTTPDSGYYAFVFGSNIASNMAVYLGWVVQFWAALPSRMALGRIPWSVSHIVVATIIVCNLLRKRWRETAFGLLFFVVAISPALFLKDHTFYLHTYIPAFGVLYLIAKIIEDVLEHPLLRSIRVQSAVLTVVLVVVTAGSHEMVRRNQRYKMFGMIDMPRSFVLRRAEIARTVYGSISAEAPFEDRIKKVYFVYAREEGGEDAKWNRTNVESAIGRGSLINLIYNRPDIEVIFGVAGDQITQGETSVSDIYFFDDYGNCMKMDPAGDLAP